jgi:hypothetical protein
MGGPIIARVPRYRASINMKVILCSHLGRLEEARDWLGRLLEIVPGLTVAGYTALLAPVLSPEILALYVEALRKAGLPEA